MLLLEFAVENKSTLTVDRIDTLAAIHRKLKHLADRQRFAAQCVRTVHAASSGDEQQTLLRRLHELLADNYKLTGSLDLARWHMLRSGNARKMALILLQLATFGRRDEADLFVAQTVMQLLCRRQKSAAEACLDECVKLSGVFYCFREREALEPPFSSPLLNFVWILIKLTNNDPPKVEAFSALLEAYKISLRRDAAYLRYMDIIGQHFFGVPPPQLPPAGGIFGNLIATLAGTETRDDSEQWHGEIDDDMD